VAELFGSDYFLTGLISDCEPTMPAQRVALSPQKSCSSSAFRGSYYHQAFACEPLLSAASKSIFRFVK